MLEGVLRRLLGAVVTLSLVVAVSGCGDTAGNASTPAASDVVETSTDVPDDVFDVALALSQIWGHLEASAASAAAGDWAFAEAHAGHPVMEYWEQVEGPLAERDLAGPLRAALDAYLDAVERRADDHAALHGEAVAATQEALREIAGERWEDPAFKAALVRGLLEAVEHEYGEAVEDGQLTELVEFQDAWGFYQVAKHVYAGIAPVAWERSAEAAEEIEHAFDELDRVFGTFVLEAGAAPATADDVDAVVGEAEAELTEAFGLAAAEHLSPAETVARIDALMRQALDAYARGETEEAYDLAADAYLKGFETIEGDLIQHGERAFVEELEVQFKELRDGIREGRSQAELRALVEDISSRLDHAVEVLQ